MTITQEKLPPIDHRGYVVSEPDPDRLLIVLDKQFDLHAQG